MQNPELSKTPLGMGNSEECIQSNDHRPRQHISNNKLRELQQSRCTFTGEQSAAEEDQNDRGRAYTAVRMSANESSRPGMTESRKEIAIRDDGAIEIQPKKPTVGIKINEKARMTLKQKRKSKFAPYRNTKLQTGELLLLHPETGSEGQKTSETRYLEGPEEDKQK